jgi:hypothetical protein
MTMIPASASAVPNAPVALERLATVQAALKRAIGVAPDTAPFYRLSSVRVEDPAAYALGIRDAARAARAAADALIDWTDPDAARARALIEAADAAGCFTRHGSFHETPWADGRRYEVATHNDPDAALGQDVGVVRLSAVPRTADDFRTLRVPKPALPEGFAQTLRSVTRSGGRDIVFEFTRSERGELSRLVDRADAGNQVRHTADLLAELDAKVAEGIRTAPRDRDGRIVVKLREQDPWSAAFATTESGEFRSTAREQLLDVDVTVRTLLNRLAASSDL